MMAATTMTPIVPAMNGRIPKLWAVVLAGFHVGVEDRRQRKLRRGEDLQAVHGDEDQQQQDQQRSRRPRRTA